MPLLTSARTKIRLLHCGFFEGSNGGGIGSTVIRGWPWAKVLLVPPCTVGKNGIFHGDMTEFMQFLSAKTSAGEVRLTGRPCSSKNQYRSPTSELTGWPGLGFQGVPYFWNRELSTLGLVEVKRPIERWTCQTTCGFGGRVIDTII